MERIKHMLELLTKEHGILTYFSFIPVALFSIGADKKRSEEQDFLGDNAPYTIIEKIKQHGPRG